MAIIKRKSRGFTLLEVIIALAILAAVSASVTQIFAKGVETTLEVEKESYAYILAESMMDELLLLDDVRAGAGSGTLADGKYRYTVDVSEQAYPGEARDDELMHVRLSIAWGQGHYATDVVLESLKIQVKADE